MSTIETMKIAADNKEGYFIINKCDKTPEQKEFNPAVKKRVARKKSVKKKAE